jgi:hypothetical protein
MANDSILLVSGNSIRGRCESIWMCPLGGTRSGQETPSVLLSYLPTYTALYVQLLVQVCA